MRRVVVPGRLARRWAGVVAALGLAPALFGCRCSQDDPPRAVGWEMTGAAAGGGGGAKRAAGDPAAVSSYGSAVSDDKFSVGPEERTALLRLARASVEGYVRGGALPEAPRELGARYPHLAAPRACFVTLRKRGELRGCIGSLEPRRSLIEDVRQNAMSAAIHDTRFEPVRASELGEIDYEISVLDLPRPMPAMPVDEIPAWLGKHRPGLIIEYRGRRSTFLPSVWEDLPEPMDFLSRLCRKQGSPVDCWRDPAARLSAYGSIHFGEKEHGAR
jgi:AmmeMemoRadiSam system protein A